MCLYIITEVTDGDLLFPTFCRVDARYPVPAGSVGHDFRGFDLRRIGQCLIVVIKRIEQVLNGRIFGKVKPRFIGAEHVGSIVEFDCFGRRSIKADTIGFALFEGFSESYAQVFPVNVVVGCGVIGSKSENPAIPLAICGGLVAREIERYRGAVTGAGIEVIGRAVGRCNPVCYKLLRHVGLRHSRYVHRAIVVFFKTAVRDKVALGSRLNNSKQQDCFDAYLLCVCFIVVRHIYGLVVGIGEDNTGIDEMVFDRVFVAVSTNIGSYAPFGAVYCLQIGAKILSMPAI